MQSRLHSCGTEAINRLVLFLPHRLPQILDRFLGLFPGDARLTSWSSEEPLLHLVKVSVCISERKRRSCNSGATIWTWSEHGVLKLERAKQLGVPLWPGGSFSWAGRHGPLGPRSPCPCFLLQMPIKKLAMMLCIHKDGGKGCSIQCW